MNAPEAVYADGGGGVCAGGRDRARAAPAGSRSLAGLGLFVASRAASIASTAVNWDEFALLDRVARTARTGVPETGGRPGLAEWLLLPLVSACSDEIATARMARWLWLGLTLCFLCGLYALLLELLRGRPQRRHDALFGVALLALVPAFLEWSLQVRTDQLALAGRRLGRDAAAGLAAARAARARGGDPVRRRLPGLAEAALRGGARGPARRPGAPGSSATCARRARRCARRSAWPASGWSSRPSAPRWAPPSTCRPAIRRSA